MTTEDFWTNIVIGTLSAVLIAIPALMAQGVNGNTLLLLGGSIAILLLAWYGRRRMADS